MPTSRYRDRRGRATCRFRSSKNLILAGDFASIILILWIFFILFFPILFNAGKIIPSRSSLFVFFDGLGLDYPAIFYQSVPGMKLEQGESGAGAGSGFGDSSTDSEKHFHSYPQLVLINEIAGFQAIDASRINNPPVETEDTKRNYSSNHINEEQDSSRELSQHDDKGISFLIDKNPQSPRERPLVFDNNKPLVLIYHTHASESFVPVSGKAYSDDPEKTVVCLGDYLANILENNYDISVLHHKEIFDHVRDGAYERARPVIEKILKQSPQIEVVIDLHRDGVSKRVTTGNIKGLETGRLLFVVGTRHGKWTENLRFNLFLQTVLDDKYPGLSRGIRRYACVYNQDLHPRSILVEIGGHENTAAEVRRAIPLLAEAVAGAFE